MPIGSKKIGSVADREPVEAQEDECCGGGCCDGGAGDCEECHRGAHHEFGKKILMTLVGVLIVYLTFYIGTLMRNNIKKYNIIGQADTMERMISVSGSAKVTGKNDIAVTTIGYTNLNSDVAAGQIENKKVMDKVLADLKAMGIDEKDLESGYSFNPEYDYTQKGQIFKGYRVQSNVTVKIRDLSKVPAVLALPGKYNANQVGSLSFTIDDPKNLKEEAREKALVDAKVNAQKLAQLLGVRLGEVISYNDYESAAPIYSYAKAAYGMGGGGLGTGPNDVSSGSQDINMNVTVSYKIYPR